MPADITVTIHPDLSEALKGLKPEPMRQAIAKGMTIGAEIIAGMVTEERLTGKGPFPVEDHRLGVVTGRLRQSLHSTPARIEGDKVIVSIGSAVEYARLHEFGWEGDVTVPSHERLGHIVKEHQRHVVIAERAPVRTGIKEHIGEIQTAITEEITKSWKS